MNQNSRVITFCLFVSSDLCNTVFFCLIFAIEILDVNEGEKDINDAMKVSEGEKNSNLKILTPVPFVKKTEEKSKQKNNFSLRKVNIFSVISK